MIMIMLTTTMMMMRRRRTEDDRMGGAIWGTLRYVFTLLFPPLSRFYCYVLYSFPFSCPFPPLLAKMCRGSVPCDGGLKECAGLND